MMLHRAIFGSLERFFACTSSTVGGNFPTWIAPKQAIVLTVSDKSRRVRAPRRRELRAKGLRVDVDDQRRQARREDPQRPPRTLPVPLRRRREGSGGGRRGRALARRGGARRDAGRRVRRQAPRRVEAADGLTPGGGGGPRTAGESFTYVVVCERLAISPAGVGRPERPAFFRCSGARLALTPAFKRMMPLHNAIRHSGGHGKSPCQWAVPASIRASSNAGSRFASTTAFASPRSASSTPTGACSACCRRTKRCARRRSRGSTWSR